MQMSRSYQFWAVLTFLSLVTASLSYRYIDVVLPIINVSITVDKDQVLADAIELASEMQWDITDYQNVTEFAGQDQLQSFVELEAGGKSAFVEMFQLGHYYPYLWHVRFFKEQQVVEMHAWFTPDGQRVGFYQKISEESLGKVLLKEQAQSVVEESIKDWCSGFDNYQLVEYDSKKQESGRVDHSFIYERSDLTIGKGLYRFQADVRGDVLTRLQPSVKIPDNFNRRYQQMRSANNLLGQLGGFFFKILYLFIFGLFGLLFFYRRNYLEILSSSIAALVVAGGCFLGGLNEAPLWCVSYNTVQPKSTFLMMNFFGQVISFFLIFGIIFISLLVAEAAGRFIFKNHVQFFKIFTLPALRSKEIFEQVLIGYLATPFMFGYVISFSYITEKYFSWWSPAGNLSDPNVIATYFPWLGAITISLQAGFLEEVVFRALPLAMIIVFKRDSKHKKWWFFGMFIMQALIFGACHANYPNQPFFARLIELILPSFGFGLLYYVFGLLPGVITHFTYDAILFALPVFMSNLFWSKIIIIFLIGLPMWVLLLIYLHNKKLFVLPVQYFNKAFISADYIPAPIHPRRIGEKIPERNRMILFFLGFLGFITFAGMYDFCPDTKSLSTTKSQALKIARHAIDEKFDTNLDASWTPVITTLDDSSATSTRFIWQVYGKQVYDLLQGSYIYGVTWIVRFVQFSGEVEDRGQEYRVVVASNECGSVVDLSHTIPEHFKGADITEKHACSMVDDFIAQKFCLEKQVLTLISVSSEKFEDRRDWKIVMQDTTAFDFPHEGQARILIKISGDEISGYSRFVYVPEAWERADQDTKMNLNFMKMILMFLLFLGASLGAVFGIKRLSSSAFGSQMMIHKGLFTALTLVITILNSFPIYLGLFNTAEPFYDQVSSIALSIVMSMSGMILFSSIVLASGAVGFIKGKDKNILRSVGFSVLAASFMMGVMTLISSCGPHLEPQSGFFACAGYSSSLIAASFLWIKIFSLVLALIIAFFLTLKSIPKYWRYQVFIQFAYSMFFGIALQSITSFATVPCMFMQGIGCGVGMYLIYMLMLRYDMTLLPLTFGVFVIYNILSEVVCPSYVSASFDALSAIVVIAAVSLFFYERAHIE